MSERENRVVTLLDPMEYQGLERLSSSGVKQLLRSPAHFRAWKDTPRLATPAMQFGTVVHTLVLEPATVAARIAVMPYSAPTRQSNAGKEWHATFAQEARGKVIIGAEDYSRACACAKAITNSYGWTLLARGGNVETSLLWNYERTLCKARPDWFAQDGSVCVDVKTTTDASREQFMRQLWNMRYDIQGAFYLEGLAATVGVLPHSFVWCVVETEPPHGVAWYRMGHRDFEIARADIANAVEVYAQCADAGNWPGYSTDIQEIRLPPWARSQSSNHQSQEY